MSDEQWPDRLPRLAHHMYWHKKERFLLESDRYPYWTLLAVEDGRLAYRINGLDGTAGFPELILCPPETDLDRRVVEPVSFHIFHFHMERAPAGQPLTMPPFPPGLTKLTIGDTARLSNTYGHLRAAARHSDNTAFQWAEHLLKDIWNQCLYEKMLAPTDPSEELPDTDDPLMKEAGRLIRESACTSFSLSSVAASLGLTPVQLTRKYQASFGVSPSEHVTSIRMAKARCLLCETAYSLDKIAEECGYENGFYLSRIFSKRIGVSPSAFRKTYRF